MNEKEYYEDDRFVIPEDIKKMSMEELEAEIAKYEAEAAAEKKRLSECKKAV